MPTRESSWIAVLSIVTDSAVVLSGLMWALYLVHRSQLLALLAISASLVSSVLFVVKYGLGWWLERKNSSSF
ncbi:MAG: hypothetical protein AMS22_12385 [Thiotrichales bacterium SG8_50]|nr:MAG: hypothetical protein AMS22_12385 [Thiotrichales bacterium SG8_50]